MRNNILKTLILIALFSSVCTAGAKEVFRWQERGHSAYSDTPNRLTPVESDTFNVRTQTVSTAQAASASEPEESAVDKQNKKIRNDNKKIEEQNKKIAEQNQNMRQEACKTARLNRQMADSVRANNRDALIKRYDQDVNTYCN
ncbi:DUF4124 domain-containing protein [Neisseriaceae bacterium ESL0693]|nr:DUF4124 domain-containing protein [Neisseriaceae bacterium ESL0693]